MKKFRSLVPDVATTDDDRLDRVCSCDACERDGQHEPACAVHEEPAEKCDCFKAT